VSYARYHSFTVRQLQAKELHDHEEQENAAGEAGSEEVLPLLPVAPGAQRGEVSYFAGQ
jgi:hypothetical protein